MSNHNIFGTDDSGVFNPLGSQKALGAAILRITGDSLIAAQVMETVGSHILVVASENLLSEPWKGYARSCIEVAEQMHRDVPNWGETLPVSGVIVDGD